MTYDARERSASSGAPVEFFTFSRDFQAWRYTSADRAIDLPTGLYQPRAISRSGVEASQEVARSTLTITAPRDLEVADLYRLAPPTLPVMLTVQQYHDGDGELIVVWTGRVVTVEWGTGGTVEISCEPIQSAVRRVGLRRAYQRGCAHVLYGPDCKVNATAYRIDATVDAVTDKTVSIGAAGTKPDAYFAGGFLEYLDGSGVVERRFITDHTGPALTLSAAPAGLGPGAAVKLFPGCDHLLATCGDKFGNALNFGGMPYIPTKNPFGSDPIF